MADTLVKNPKLIVGTQSQVEAEMGANDIGFATDVEFYTSKQIDELLSKAGGASLPILMPTWSDHLLNDVSWLRANTFSWQSGDVYKAAYEHLASELTEVQTMYGWENEKSTVVYTYSAAPKAGDPVVDANGTQKDTVVSSTESVLTTTGSYSGTSQWDRYSSYDKQLDLAKTDTIGDITITYYLAQDGHKICLPDQESDIVALYEKTGAADYYLLDTTNKQFKLPRKQKRTLIQAVKNTDGTWYNLYSDGWVEQGGQIIRGSITFEVPMADINYNVSGAQIRSGSTNGTYYNAFKFVNMRETGIDLDNAQGEDPLIAWSVSGYAAESAYASAGMRLEYYYVGNFEQSAIEQTAGLNAELFNGKADVSRVETLEGYDYVVESQLPTSDNGYTWYRKYKSGWVEQGGQKGAPSGASEISFPIPMSNSEYTPSVNALVESSNARIVQVQAGRTAEHLNVITNNSFTVYWTVFGMAA